MVSETWARSPTQRLPDHQGLFLQVGPVRPGGGGGGGRPPA